ncbi:MAG: glycosyltransferase family A protein [Candidatus Dojkabacteria bacterium]
MSDKPLVSIIIPLYNQGQFLEDSVNSALAQTYSNIEVIIVEDGSTDGKTPAIADKFQSEKVKVIHKENGGLPMARNTGIYESKAEFFVPLDADDKLDPKFIEKTMEVMTSNEKVGVVYTDQQFFGIENKIMSMREFDLGFQLVLNHVSVCSLIRRKAFEEVKTKNEYGYNPNMKFGYEEWDLYIGIAESGWEFKVIHEPLFLYRRRGNSMVSNTLKNHEILTEQMMKNHKETYMKYSAESFLALQKLYMDKVRTLEDLTKETTNTGWLLKRLVKSI